MDNYTIGRHSYSYAIHRGNANSVSIGNYTSIAENTIFDRGFQHKTDQITTFPLNKIWSELPSNIDARGAITIGSDVWIGEGAVIMGNVNIGSGAIIGCNSIITKDVPCYAVVVGSGRIIRRRFTPDVVSKLLSISWWRWSDEKVRENAHLLQSNNVDEFLRIHG